MLRVLWAGVEVVDMGRCIAPLAGLRAVSSNVAMLLAVVAA
jgi:hypothetical protein